MPVNTNRSHRDSDGSQLFVIFWLFWEYSLIGFASQASESANRSADIWGTQYQGKRFVLSDMTMAGGVCKSRVIEIPEVQKVSTVAIRISQSTETKNDSGLEMEQSNEVKGFDRM